MSRKKEKDVSEEREKCIEAIAAELQQVPDESLDAVGERLYKMIEYAVARVDYYESQRTNMYNLSIGLLAGALAIFSIVSTVFIFLLDQSNKNLAYREPLVVILLVFMAIAAVLLIGSLAAIWKYTTQSAYQYPYRKVSDIKSWYFFYSKPKSNKITDHLDGLMEWSKKWIKHMKADRNILIEDLEQVYILFALQRYKRDYVNTLKRCIRVCIFISSVILVIGIAAVVKMEWPF